MRKILTLIAVAVLAVACGDAGSEQPETLVLMSHDSFASGVNDETFAAFTAETGIGVEVIAAGDAGSMVNQAVLSKDNPLADVLFGVDDTFLSRALEEEIFVGYDSELLHEVVDGLVAGTTVVTPIDFGDVCLNYDKAWFEENQIAVPDDLEQLRDPEYAALLTVEHPATSSPGLAFLLATIERYG